ncbi:MFS transporter [Aureisphaera galaxeae]|uniref:MFS transporter n=1 Tax=Aureisphaera galaxeae TaxID=1538023 RepID=UPI002350C541|nr:MFS transporter [Aureisphaera galaxeae]MDC8004146.1 MFS transporter [Aureisphaera galaxeae]
MAKLSAFLKSNIFPILLVNFIGTLGYGIILPFLAFLIIDFGGNAVFYGIIASTYPMFQMIGAPVLGKWSDKIGRKRVLLISQAGTLLSWLIFLLAFFVPLDELFKIEMEGFGVLGFTIPLIVILLARSLDGLTGGNISVANAYLSDVSSEEDRKKNFGKMSASMSLGFMLGPAIAGLLAAFPNSNLLTIIVAAFISLVGLLAIYFFLPEVKLKEAVYHCPKAKLKKVFGAEYKECHKMKEKESSNWKTIITQGKAPIMITLFFLIFLAFNFFYATFSMYSSTSLAWSAEKVGLFFTILSSVMILFQGPVLSWLSDKYSEEILFTVGAFVMVFSFSCLTSTHSLWLYTGAVLYGVGNGIMWPSYLSILSKVGSANNQGALQGIANSVGSFASIIGLVFGGFLLAKLSKNIYFLSAFLLLIISLVGWFLARKVRVNKV